MMPRSLAKLGLLTVIEHICPSLKDPFWPSLPLWIDLESDSFKSFSLKASPVQDVSNPFDHGLANYVDLTSRRAAFNFVLRIYQKIKGKEVVESERVEKYPTIMTSWHITKRLTPVKSPQTQDSSPSPNWTPGLPSKLGIHTKAMNISAWFLAQPLQVPGLGHVHELFNPWPLAKVS